MGNLVYVLGRSGSGKSYSMRNFPADELAVINVQGKILPFRNSGKIKAVMSDDSKTIVSKLKELGKSYKDIVIDDFQYVMANEFMRRSTERGYDKFTEIARHAWDIANVVRELPQDVIVYIFCHLERGEDGSEKIKTIGKLLDEKICLEGMSTIVLKTSVTDGHYYFLTQNNGSDTTKSPAGMFPTYAIENDLYYVSQKIRNYYGFSGAPTDDEIAEQDKAAAKSEITPEETGEKKRRGRRKDADDTTNKTSSPAEGPAADGESASDAGVHAATGRKRRTKAEKEAEETAGSDKTESDNTDAGAEDALPATNTRRGRRGNTGTLADERKAVRDENMQKIAETGIEESGDADSVPFEDVKEPELTPPPKRKRRGSTEPEETATEKATKKVSQNEETEEPATRRRRRRV